MTKYFKLLGVALIAMSMALVSCDTTEENPTDDQQQDQNDNNGGNGGNGGNEGGGNTPDPNTPSVPTATAGTVAVTFGTDTWTAGELVAGYLQQYNAAVLYAYTDAQGNFPIMEIESYLPTSMTGAITSGEFDPSTREYAGGELVKFEYYHEMLLYVDENNSGAYEQGETTFGDYWAKNATVTISTIDLTGMTMTATGSAVMFEALPVLNEQVAIGASNRIGLSFNANAIDIQVAKGGVFPKTAKAENLSVARR